MKIFDKIVFFNVPSGHLLALSNIKFLGQFYTKRGTEISDETTRTGKVALALV
jgi:hypothetical protein